MAGILVDYHVGNSHYACHNVLGLTAQTKKFTC